MCPYPERSPSHLPRSAFQEDKVPGNRLLSVLVIEDNPADAGLIRAMLGNRTFTLTFSSRLAEAQHLMQQQSFDIILMDLGLPDSQGLPSLEVLLREAGIPIVVMTGLDDDGLAQQALQRGAQDYIIKGAEADHFLARSLQYAVERHQIDQQLRHQKAQYKLLTEQFRALFNGIPDGLVLLTRDLDIIWANEGACRFLPETEKPVEGKKCHQVFFSEETPCPDCIVQRCFASGQSLSDKVTTPDGRILGLRAFPIKNRDGVVDRVIELSNDITERVRLQSEAIRTDQLASLGELAAGVAHEINNPINGIINYATILKKCAADNFEAIEIAGRIEREGDRIASIVSKLLHFSRQRQETKRPASVAAILDDTLGLIRNQLYKDGIELCVDLPDDLPAVNVQPQQIEQVFLNLINNARYALNSRFPDRRSAEKKLTIRADYLGGGFIRTSIHDNGTGIPDEIRNRILAPFFSTKPVGEGTGLGLSISHSIIQEHGGRLTFESEVGVFTRVQVDLPCALGIAENTSPQ
ncbi:hypothetical protein B5V00_15530 [Geothermobacter hydrogeniphilus]|uniref:histidine kinase n=1 Tax=Geothermobacter hydrogeniphilus TaxID=1969733 RepID=A0A1X0XPP4_9BACT|nr:hypothetical protein B5V00_15530 [Geothermobacter hydrogeniphilus]